MIEKILKRKNTGDTILLVGKGSFIVTPIFFIITQFIKIKEQKT